jgi:type IV pilus assembly protein PilQ
MNIGRMRGLKRLLYGSVLACGVIACASTVMETASDEATIRDVQVVREGDSTIVTLVGVADPAFTAFLQQHPQRLVVDLAAVELASEMDAVEVFDGLVEEVSLDPYSTGAGDPMTRIEVTLAVPADYDVAPGADGLEIALSPIPGMATRAPVEGEELADDPWESLPAELAEGDGAEPGAGFGRPGPAGGVAPAATHLTAVDARKLDGGLLLRLRADGAVESVATFTLEDPERLVVDLPKLQSQVERDRIELGSPLARRVRIGQHVDHVRVVVDGASDSRGFQGRRVVPTGDGVVISLGDGPAVELAMDEWLAGSRTRTAERAPAASEEPAPDSGEMIPIAEAGAEDASDGWEAAALSTEQTATSEPAVTPASDAAAGAATVRGVEFDSQRDRDRIVVVADRPVDYVVYEPDRDTVVLSIPGAVLARGIDGRIAPEPGGPVSLVNAFEQPEVGGPEVRVVVERALDLEPAVTRQGAVVMMDFARDGSVAATPPVLAAAAAALEQENAGGVTTAAATPTSAAPAAMAAATPSRSPAIAPSPQGDTVPASLEPPAAISLLQEGGLMDGKQYSGRRISLDFKDIDMADVLRLIAEVSDLNVIAGDEVQGRVTIRLVDVPWDQALDVILLTKGLGFVRVGNVLRIAPADLLKQEEEARLQERRALEQLEDLVVKLQPVNYANVRDVQGMVGQLLTPRGTVQTDTRTNTLIIKDIPSVVDEATALVKAVDTQTPQVMIEAKIVEASLDFSREFGVTWGLGVQPLEDAFNTNSPERQDLGNDFFRFNTLGNNNALFTNPVAGSNGLFNLAGFILDEKLNLNLTLQAAEANGDGKVVSSPRLVTLDNNKATIEQGVSIPFQTFENGDAQLEFVDAVLKLDVTPHITVDRSIIMDIVVSRNAPDASVVTLTGSPAIAKNQVNTETLVKDGQTLVIGGIYVVDKSKKQAGVPGLYKIPILGALFRSDTVKDVRKELLIFVTPRVVMTPDAAT